jgi:hypothetical protein
MIPRDTSVLRSSFGDVHAWTFHCRVRTYLGCGCCRWHVLDDDDDEEEDEASS